MATDYNRELAKIKLRVSGKMPFWGMFIHSGGGAVFMPQPEMDKIMPGGIACTDGKTVWVGPKFFDEYNPNEREFILVHELIHKQHCHCARRKLARKSKTVGGVPFDEEVWIKAVETLTNTHAKECGIGQVPKDAILDPQVDYKMSLIDIYRLYYQQQQGGGGKPGKPDKGGLGGDLVVEGTPEETQATLEQAEVEQRVLTKAAAQASKAVGKGAGTYERWMEEQAEPKIDWRQQMASMMQPYMGRERLDFRTMHMGKFVRSNGMVISPKRRGDRMGRVVVVCDTSGSIGDAEIKTFLGEVAGILQDVSPIDVVITGVDAAMPTKWATLTSYEDMAAARPAITGGGGTDFRPAFKWVEEQEMRPACFIYFTDGYGPFPKEAPGYPVIWAMTTDVQAPWGERVQIEVRD